MVGYKCLLAVFIHQWPPPVSNSVVYLHKFHQERANILIINIDKFLQRGRILIAFGWIKQLNTSAMNNNNLFVALVFYGVI